MSSVNETPPEPDQARVIIVGAGPIGLELSVALRQHAIEHRVFDAGPIGQTMTWWAPGTRWFSSNERIAIAGVPLLTVDQAKATREEYLTYLRSVVAQFELPVSTFCPVVDIQRSGGRFTVTTRDSSGRRQRDADAVVLAIGGTDFPRRLDVPGQELPHVDGYLREPHRYAGRKVVIIGGRNSAVEAALRLHHVGARVTLCYRGDELPSDGIKYWLLPEITGLIGAGRIVGCFGRQVQRITEDGVVVLNHKTNQQEVLAADDVLSLIGYEQDKSLLRAAGVELLDDCQRPRFDPETMQTNVAGIYVAGTVVAGTQNSKYKIFLENCHDHVGKILRHLTGQSVTLQQAYVGQIESQPES